MDNRSSLAPSLKGTGTRYPGRCKGFAPDRPIHRRIVLLAGSPGSVNLNAPALAGEESRLEFFAFDASYVERLRSGDARIEGHFVNYFSELIRIKLRSRLSSKEAIEDVRQQTFMRVLVLLRGEGGLRQPDRLGAFVNSVCNHVLQEHYRSKKRTEATIDDETEANIQVVLDRPVGVALETPRRLKPMDHQQATQLTAVEKYLLDELTGEERD